MYVGIDFPILYLDDVPGGVRFYVERLGAEVLEDLGDYVELRLGKSKLALNRADGDSKVAGKSTLMLLSDGIEADFSDLEGEVEIVADLRDRGYGLTFMFLDPAGNKLEVVAAG